jgi:hypothetical protein
MYMRENIALVALASPENAQSGAPSPDLCVLVHVRCVTMLGAHPY